MKMSKIKIVRNKKINRSKIIIHENLKDYYIR